MRARAGCVDTHDSRQARKRAASDDIFLPRKVAIKGAFGDACTRGEFLDREGACPTVDEERYDRAGSIEHGLAVSRHKHLCQFSRCRGVCRLRTDATSDTIYY
jgi:hypothetical protein